MRGAARREGSTLGSPRVNRLTTLLLLSVLGSIRFDPRTDSRSGAISWQGRSGPLAGWGSSVSYCMQWVISMPAILMMRKRLQESIHQPPFIQHLTWPSSISTYWNRDRPPVRCAALLDYSFFLCRSRYNNRLKAKLVSIFTDLEERREKREENLALVLAPNLARKHRYLWIQIKIHVRKSRKEKVKHDII